MNPVTRAMLLREALSTTRMSLPDLSDLVRRKGECPIHDNQGEPVIAQRNYAVAPGEWVQEWLEETDTDTATLAHRLGIAESYVVKLLAGEIAVSDSLAQALSDITGIPVESWQKWEAVYQADKIRLAQTRRRDELLDEIVEEDQALIDQVGNGTINDMSIGDESLVERLADER